MRNFTKLLTLVVLFAGTEQRAEAVLVMKNISGSFFFLDTGADAGTYAGMLTGDTGVDQFLDETEGTFMMSWADVPGVPDESFIADPLSSDYSFDSTLNELRLDIIAEDATRDVFLKLFALNDGFKISNEVTLDPRGVVIDPPISLRIRDVTITDKVIPESSSFLVWALYLAVGSGLALLRRERRQL